MHEGALALPASLRVVWEEVVVGIVEITQGLNGRRCFKEYMSLHIFSIILCSGG